MNQKEFNEVIIRQTDRCKSMLVAKGAEYAYGDAVQASDFCIGYVYG